MEPAVADDHTTVDGKVAAVGEFQGAAGNVDIGTVVGQAVGGGVAGAILTAVVGLIKSMMSGQTAR